MSTRVTTYTYDFRGRHIAAEGEENFYEKTYYDNLGRVANSERYHTTSSGNRISPNGVDGR